MAVCGVGKVSDHKITPKVDMIVHEPGGISIQHFFILHVKAPSGEEHFELQRVIYDISGLKKKGGVVFLRHKFKTFALAQKNFWDSWFPMRRAGYRDIEVNDYFGEFTAIRDARGKLLTIVSNSTIDRITVVVNDNFGMESYFDAGMTYIMTELEGDFVSVVGRYGESHLLSLERVSFEPVILR